MWRLTVSIAAELKTTILVHVDFLEDAVRREGLAKAYTALDLHNQIGATHYR